MGKVKTPLLAVTTVVVILGPVHLDKGRERAHAYGHAAAGPRPEGDTLSTGGRGV